MGGRRSFAAVVAVLVGVGLAPIVSAKQPAGPADPVTTNEFVLSPEGNRLWAYDAVGGERQLLIPSRADAPTDPNSWDVNGQVCMSPGGKHFVAGEDTGIDSHDDDVAGWGYFRISGSELGELAANRVGKLAPGEGGYAGDPDNYGCGFLDHKRLFTTAIGDRFPHEEANGQLFLWFGPFDLVDEPVARCEVDDTLATAGGIAVDTNGDVYVAANRPDRSGDPGGIWRYSGPWPDDPGDCSWVDSITRELVVPAVPAPDPRALTPSSVVIAPNGNLVVSSVFTGTVSEYTKTTGQWVRDLYPTSPVAPRTGPTGDTPYGLAFTSDGSLWISDLGIVIAEPAEEAGSLIRVQFHADGSASRPATIADGLDFPDGLGVYRPDAPAVPASSEWPCGNWGMYGRTLTRQFSSDCPTPISPQTVAGLRPAWVFRPDPRLDPNDVDQATFTASPTVVDGVVYIGGWDGHMYAIDAETGKKEWAYETVAAPGATFGPIVSTAAVAEVDGERLVIFGSGPRVYALRASDGTKAWEHYVGGPNHLADQPAEVESSPVVWNGVVYVGMDVHNQPGDAADGVRGGMLALDAATGALKWKYEPEASLPASGCGGVWGSPVIDGDTGLLYFGTANCPAVNENPDLPMESIYALDAHTGAARWTFDPHDPPDLDEDFGATPNLFTVGEGDTKRKILGAGSKDGSYYALDAATGKDLSTDRPIWNTAVVEPAPGVGGFIGSTTVWGGRIFGSTAIGSPPWYHAFDGATGKVLWQSGTAPSYAPSAVTNGVVFAGALDGIVKAYDADTGVMLWSSPVAGPVSSGPVVVGDMLFIGAGTSSSDLCAKGRPDSAACFLAFDTLLGQQGGVHAFRLAP